MTETHRVRHMPETHLFLLAMHTAVQWEKGAEEDLWRILGKVQYWLALSDYQGICRLRACKVDLKLPGYHVSALDRWNSSRCDSEISGACTGSNRFGRRILCLTYIVRHADGVLVQVKYRMRWHRQHRRYSSHREFSGRMIGLKRTKAKTTIKQDDGNLIVRWMASQPCPD